MAHSILRIDLTLLVPKSAMQLGPAMRSVPRAPYTFPVQLGYPPLTDPSILFYSVILLSILLAWEMLRPFIVLYQTMEVTFWVSLVFTNYKLT